jgi:ABC-type nitrate/sulfonate/bicarbonate transport system ATPase subunit
MAHGSILRFTQDRQLTMTIILLFHDNPEVVFLGDRLVADGGAAKDAGVIEFVTIRQNKEETFFHGNGFPAFGAVELRRIEISISGFFHSFLGVLFGYFFGI